MIKCNMLARFLNFIYSNNLLPTTHNNELSNNMVWIVYNLMAQHEVNVSVIICHAMLAKAEHSTVKLSFPYGVMITILLASCNVRFPKDALVLK